MTEFNTDNLIQGNFGESEGQREYGQLIEHPCLDQVQTSLDFVNRNMKDVLTKIRHPDLTTKQRDAYLKMAQLTTKLLELQSKILQK